MFVSFLLLIFCRSLSQSQGQRSGAPAGPIPACSFCSCFDSCPLPVSFIAASLLARDRPSRIDRRLSAFRAPARRSDAGGGASSLLGLSAPGPPKQAGADFHYLFCLAGLGGNQGMHTHTGSTFSSPLGAASGGDSYCTRSFLASPSAILIFLFPCFYIYFFFSTLRELLCTAAVFRTTQLRGHRHLLRLRIFFFSLFYSFGTPKTTSCTLLRLGCRADAGTNVVMLFEISLAGSLTSGDASSIPAY